MNLILFPLYILSALFLPWWFVIPLGIVVATLPFGSVVTVTGGIILDATYGSPIAALWYTSHVYTLVSVLIVVSIELLARRVVDYDAYY
jgi:hypothetical protein